MTPASVLVELLERLGAGQSDIVVITNQELNKWPTEAVKAMKTQKLIVKASPAISAICPGCERECIMSVHTLPDIAGDSVSFVVCDKRSDINRVPVTTSCLEQWQTSGTLIADLLAGLLSLRRPSREQVSANRWEIGLLKGRKHSSHVVLSTDKDLILTIAGHSIALSDVLELENNSFTIDKRTLIWFVDNPVTGGGDIESAVQRCARVKKRVQELKTQGVKAFLKTVAEEEGISTTRVKQLINDNESTPKNKTTY